MLHLGETGEPACKTMGAFEIALKPYLERLSEG